MSANTIPVCTCCPQTPPDVCGDEATCNKWCLPTKKAFARSECCACPCPGRRSYPTCWRTFITGIVLTSERMRNSVTGKEVQITSGNIIPPWNDCTGFDDAAVPPTQNTCAITFSVWAADGTPESVDVAGTAGMSSHDADGITATECDRAIPSFLLTVDAAQLNHGGYAAEVNSPFNDGGLQAFPEDPASVERCFGGSINGTTGDVTIPIATNGGQITVTPTCTKCDDTDCEMGGDDASICASDIHLEIDIWEGETLGGSPVYNHYEIDLEKNGSCRWAGTAPGIAADIFPREQPDHEDECCCPNLVANLDCCADNPDAVCCATTEAGPCGPPCDTCWTLTINVAATTCNLEFHGSPSSCPPIGFNLFSDTGCDGSGFPRYENFSLSFGSECP